MEFNPNRILGIVLPTNEPDVAKNYIFSSLAFFREMAPICTFLLNFQDPWTDPEIEYIQNLLTASGFSYISEKNAYQVKGRGMVPMNRIRNDTSLLMPDALFYALADDDFKFRGPTDKNPQTAGFQYLSAIHYLLTHENCGVLLMGGTLFRRYPIGSIGPVDLDSPYLTSKGFIVPSLGGDGPLLPADSLGLLGSDEEKVIAGARLVKGMYPAKLGNTRVLHYESHSKQTGIIAGKDMYQWNSAQILENNNSKYIREHYNERFKGKGYYNLVTYERYISAGGIDVWADPNYVHDYLDQTASDLLISVVDLAKRRRFLI